MDKSDFFEIRFDADYKGKFADEGQVKKSAVGSALFIGVVCALIGAYVAFWPYHRVITPIERFTGIAIMIVGFVSLALGPLFVALFVRMNRGLTDKINISLVYGTDVIEEQVTAERGSNGNDEQPDKQRQHVDTPKWHFTITAGSKNGVYTDQGEINMLVVQKRVARFTTFGGKEYFIPLRFVDTRQEEQLKQIADDVKKLRTVSTM